MLDDTPAKLEDDPRTKFRVFLLASMTKKKLDVRDIASRTRIPLSRLTQIISGAAGVALLSDLCELSDMLGISLDSFFL